jgi:RHS repeat-associated protein
MGSIQPLSSGQIAYTSTTDYCGNVIYEDGILSKILTDEGYITLSGSTPTYHYLKDHLGNNRVVMAQSGTVEQINHYYPFGGLFGEGTATSNQAYKYNGKELDRMHGLDWYDYGARNYDAAIGRWQTMDPLAEKYINISPYNYVANNPIIFVDKNGREIYIITSNKDLLQATIAIKETSIGKQLWDKYGKNNDHDIYISAQQFSKDNIGGYTYAYVEKYGMIKDQKINISQFYDLAPYTRYFSSFDGLDVSRSKDKNIHLVSMNEKAIGKEGNKGENKFNGGAYMIFHEIDAHINKYTNGNVSAEHNKHGYSIMTKEINGQKVQTVSIKKNSDAWRMMIELINLKKEEMKNGEQ